MAGRRISHQIGLAFVFGIIAVAFASAIVTRAIAAIGSANDTISYASTEAQGIVYLSRTQRVLDSLVTVRNAAAAAHLESQSGDDRGGSRAALAQLTSEITRIPDRPDAKSSLDVAIGTDWRSLCTRWAAASGRAPGSSPEYEAVVAATVALIVGVQTQSGIANDPSIDGVNFGDALVRFPISLNDGSAAASIALKNMADANDALPPRFAVAQLLAMAQGAVDVGLQDAEDEISVDPVAAAPLVRATTANVAAFKAIKARLMRLYVSRPPRGKFKDRELLRGLVRFSASSFAVSELFRQNLDRTVRDRIDHAHRDQSRSLAAAAVELCVDVCALFALAGISIVSYRNAGRHMAERASTEARQAELESELRRAHAQQELLRARGQFRAVFDHAPTGMLIVDRECRIVESNDAARAVFADAAGPGAASFIDEHAAIVDAIFAGTVDVHSDECNYIDKATSRWFDLSIAPVHAESGGAVFAVFMLRDITENKMLEARLVYEAGHDALTGLPNRPAFLAAIQRALDERTAAADIFCVVFVDFNDFKAINDSFGHAAGDRFLIEGSARLRDAVRETDVLARIGGDEFAVLLYGSDRADIESNVRRLESAVTVPVNIEGQLVASSASFGVAQAEAEYALAAELIRDADTAMYHAKAQGGRNFVVFDAAMRESAVRRMQLSIDLVRALDDGELELLYQPIVNLADGMLAGCEALLRWPRHDGSFVSPSEFIPLAEENGSIIAIGQLVTSTAARQMHRWNELAHGQRLTLPPGFVVHINLAAAEVNNIDLSAKLAQSLAGLDVGRDQLMLEITEGNVLKSTLHTRSTLDRLTVDGFRICIDDFGTGYSSLRYLNDLPLHSFKIDRSFVSNGGEGLANASIVEMLMVLSRSLGLDVVAEGIETGSQWEQLCDLGCIYGQGHFFAPAVDAATFTRMLEANVSLAPARRSADIAC